MFRISLVFILKCGSCLAFDIELLSYRMFSISWFSSDVFRMFWFSDLQACFISQCVFFMFSSARGLQPHMGQDADEADELEDARNSWHD